MCTIVKRVFGETAISEVGVLIHNKRGPYQRYYAL